MPGKTISPHLAEKKFIKSGGYFETCNIENLFIIKGNPQLDKEKLSFSKDSSYPYFTRTVFNNGIYGYVDYYDDKHLVKGNSIAVGMMGMQFFYMAHDFYAGQFTKTAFPKFEGFNWRVALWFIAWFNKSSKKYLGLLVRDFEKAFLETEISVPRNSDGSLAIEFMESRIREMEESRIREMEAYLKVAGFEDCELTEEEWSTLRDFKNHKTRPIVISTIFDIKKGKRLTKDNMIPGTINFIGSTSVNNGVTAKVSNSSHIHNGNTITVTYNGSVGEAFYQTDSYWASDDVNVLTFKRLLNERLALFFCASLRKSGKKYGYTYKWTKELMEKDEIILPVTSSSSIDYKFMETYIRAIEKLTIQRVKDWRAKEIKTTMDIVKDDDTEKSSLQPSFGSKHYEMQEEDVSMMVADNIFIPYSVEVRLWNTKREDLFEGNLDLLLMYAITPSARHKTESACKIALGIKETNLSAEAIKAFKSVRYIMFHYWKNSEATPFELTAPVRLVEKESIPEGFLIRQEKNAKQYLLIEYNSDKPADLGECDILKAQRKGSDRYIPFVCKIGNIKVGNND